MLQFEKTSDHLFEAAYHGQTDAICGMQNMCTHLTHMLRSNLRLFSKEIQIQGNLFVAICGGEFSQLAGLIWIMDS